MPDCWGLPLQEFSPLLGQAGSRDRANQDNRQVAALKSLWMDKVTSVNTLSVVTRLVCLLYNLMSTIIGSKDAFQMRTQLVDSVMPAAAALITGSYHDNDART